MFLPPALLQEFRRKTKQLGKLSLPQRGSVVQIGAEHDAPDKIMKMASANLPVQDLKGWVRLIAIAYSSAVFLAGAFFAAVFFAAGFLVVVFFFAAAFFLAGTFLFVRCRRLAM